MDKRELLRLREVNRRLERRARKKKKIQAQWEEIDRVRRNLEREVKALQEERTALAQGQLMFAHAS